MVGRYRRTRWGVLLAIGAGAALAGCASGSGSAGTGDFPGAEPSLSSAPDYETDSGETRSTAATLGIPPGHLPPPGQCKIWVPGRPPGHQKGSGDCDELERRVPAGAWLVYRPSKNRKEVKVWTYDDRSPRVTSVRIFDVVTGRLLREERSGS